MGDAGVTVALEAVAEVTLAAMGVWGAADGSMVVSTPDVASWAWGRATRGGVML
jgi:hypothetical protein